MTPKQDTKGKPVSDDAIPMHKKLAMGKPVDTGGKTGPGAAKPMKW
jgi:hypothetical protein